MKRIIYDIIISIIADAVLVGVPYLSLRHKYELMDAFFIIAFIAILFFALLYVILLNRLRRYTHAQNIQTFTHLSVIRDIFESHPEIRNEYIRDIEGMNRINPLSLQTLDDLFIFDKDSTYREAINNLAKSINQS